MDGEIGHDRVSGVGSALRACRLRHGIPLADVARALRIRQSFLAAIEDGRFSELPGATYTLGFVRAYAEFLALDGDEVIRRLRVEEHQAPPTGELHFPTPSEETGTPRGGILLVGALLAAVAYGGWYFLSSQDEQRISQLADPIPEQLSALISGAPADDPPEHSEANAADSAAHASSAATERAAAASNVSARPAGASPGSRRRADEAVAPAHAATRPADVATQPADTTTRPAAVDGRAATTAARVAPSAADGTPADNRISADDASSGEPPASAAVTRGDGAPPAETSATAMARRSGSDVATVVDAPNQIVIRATEASWIEIRDRRGRRLTGRLMQPGETLDVPEQTGLQMTVGNAGGVLLVVDGQALPPLGESGVVRRGVSLDAEDLRTTATP